MFTHQLSRYVLLLLSAFLAGAAVPALAATQLLYDAADAPNLQYTPTIPGWLASNFLFMTETATAQGTEAAPTGGNTAVGGYANHAASIELSPALQVHTGAVVNPAFPMLDRHAGYSLDIGFRITGESHSNANRAGFSITLIGSDLMGVELGFQNDRIFAQETGPSFFTAAENSTGAAAGLVFVSATTRRRS